MMGNMVEHLEEKPPSKEHQTPSSAVIIFVSYDKSIANSFLLGVGTIGNPETAGVELAYLSLYRSIFYITTEKSNKDFIQCSTVRFENEKAPEDTS